MKKLLILCLMLFLSACSQTTYIYQRDMWTVRADRRDKSNESGIIVLRSYDEYLNHINEVVNHLDFERLNETFFDDYYLIFIYFVYGHDHPLSGYSIEDISLKHKKLSITISYPYASLIGPFNTVIITVGILIKIEPYDIDSLSYTIISR